MLVITRRKDESLLIGDDIEIKIVKVEQMLLVLLER